MYQRGEREATLKQRVELAVRGRTSEWAVHCDMSREQIDAMVADGIDVGILHHSVPMWAVDMGLLRPWCFVQDVWNFRNHFNK